MIPRLVPDPTVSVPVQETTLSIDMLGRYFCNSWDEVQNNGGEPFDVVVIGAGMHGGYVAEKFYRYGEGIGLRVLVLEAGPFLVSTHLQNLPHVGVNVPPANIGPVTGNDKDPGLQSLVWGYPWHSSQTFPGLAFCIGGRSLFWGGWCPRLTPDDLKNPLWPKDVVAYLNANYPDVEKEIGVSPTTDYISGNLFDALLSAFQAAAPAGYVVAEAPLAVQGKADESGLFAFDKYSSAYLLLDALREDIGRRLRFDAAGNAVNTYRRLMLVPRVHVARLRPNGSAVTGIDLVVNGQAQPLAAPLLSPNCTVVLALGTFESTRLALESIPSPHMGANLMAHLRSNITVRIKRSTFGALPPSPQDLEAAALIVRGTTANNQRFHIQVTAAAIQGNNPEQNMFTAIPDLDLLGQIRTNQDPDWIVLILRCVGEMVGDPTLSPSDPQNPPDPAKSWVNLTNAADPNQNDLAFGHRRAWVNLVPSDADRTAWQDMEEQALALALNVAGDPANIQYWDNNKPWDNILQQWSDQPPAPPLLNNGRDPIGSTHHEGGTLYLGAPGKGVTDATGKFQHMANVYVAGPALFPTLGSANPSLTALTLARQTAHAIVARYTPQPNSSFKSFYNGSLAGWQMAGSGRFVQLPSNVLETQGGLGLLWYTREVFGNFVLRLEWLSPNPTTRPEDNSGVFIRFPAANASDPANDWKGPALHGYEIQIDDLGIDPGPPEVLHEPRHQTGAIYGFAASASVASLPANSWNTFEIEANGDRIKVTLNGLLVTDYTADGSRPRAGHIGLQNHTGRVQFRNIQIRSLP
jgi:choline dehydrogenase-like flavoprotein